MAGSTDPFVAYVTSAGAPTSILPYNNASKLVIFNSALYVSIGNRIYMVGSAGAMPQSGPATMTPVLATSSGSDLINSFVWQNSSMIWTCSGLGILQWSNYPSGTFVVVGGLTVTGACYDLTGTYVSGAYMLGISGQFTAPTTANVLAYNVKTKASPTAVQTCTHYVGGVGEFTMLVCWRSPRYVISTLARIHSHGTGGTVADLNYYADAVSHAYANAHVDADDHPVQHEHALAVADAHSHHVWYKV